MNNKLRELRLSKGLSQESLAHELGISQKAYSKIENGQVCLSQDKMLKLSKIYNIPLDHICKISCECSNSSTIVKVKEFLSEKRIEIPDFLK